MPTRILIAWFICLATVGCATTAFDVARPVKPPTVSEASNMKSPFLLREAKLPRGVPPPGPVGQVIFKEYPEARGAVVRSEALGQGADENRMFKPLFEHIKSNEIAMSAPVEITWSPLPGRDAPAKPVAMAFFYGEPSIGKTGVDGSVEVLDVHPMKVVSIGVRGSYNSAHFEAALGQLNAWLAAHPGKDTVSGSPRYLGYNSPFVPWLLRYGEVQVPVMEASE
jgi:hypothetical protein